MDREHLAKLYTTGQYADCIVVSAQKHKFKAHRNVLSQYPHLTEAMDGEHRIHLTESTEVTGRLLRWMYGVEWPEINVQPTRAGVGADLVDILSLCDAAEKVSLTTAVAIYIELVLISRAVRHLKARRRCIRRGWSGHRPNHHSGSRLARSARSHRQGEQCWRSATYHHRPHAVFHAERGHERRDQA